MIKVMDQEDVILKLCALRGIVTKEQERVTRKRKKIAQDKIELIKENLALSKL